MDMVCFVCGLTPEVSGVTTRSEATTAARPLDRNVMRLAALFVQPDGCYAGLPEVDAWPEHRDARRYSGPLPVVAHPPCQLWGAMANANYARWGGEHNRPGNDGGCFAAALDSVRRFGGVLEHPAKTKAWQRTGWHSLQELAGSEPLMAAGCARFGKAPTGTVQTSRHGSTTTGRTHRLSCGGRGQKGRIRLVFTTSEERQRTSRPLASERRTPRLWSFATNCCAWR